MDKMTYESQHHLAESLKLGKADVRRTESFDKLDEVVQHKLGSSVMHL